MEFSVSRADLVRELSLSQGVVEKKTTIPILSNVLLRDLLRDGRILRLHLQIPDRPGVLADIAGKIGSSGGNIIEVSHQRLFASSSSPIDRRLSSIS